jgi:hypothetical protein
MVSTRQWQTAVGMLGLDSAGAGLGLVTAGGRAKLEATQHAARAQLEGQNAEVGHDNLSSNFLGPPGQRDRRRFDVADRAVRGPSALEAPSSRASGQTGMPPQGRRRTGTEEEDRAGRTGRAAAGDLTQGGRKQGWRRRAEAWTRASHLWEVSESAPPRLPAAPPPFLPGFLPCSRPARRSVLGVNGRNLALHQITSQHLRDQDVRRVSIRAPRRAHSTYGLNRQLL